MTPQELATGAAELLWCSRDSYESWKEHAIETIQAAIQKAYADGFTHGMRVEHRVAQASEWQAGYCEEHHQLHCPECRAAHASEPWKTVPVTRQSGEVWTGLANIDCGNGRLLGSMNEQVALSVVAAHNAAERSTGGRTDGYRHCSEVFQRTTQGAAQAGERRIPEQSSDNMSPEAQAWDYPLPNEMPHTIY